MKLLVTFTGHAVEMAGRFYNRSKALVNYEHLCRYRQAGGDVVVMLRCRRGEQVDASWPRIDGEGVSVWPVPDPASPLRALWSLPRILWAALQGIRACDGCLLKLPEPTSTVVGLLLLAAGKKYAVEVVADAAEGIRWAKRDMPLVGWYSRLFEVLTRLLVRRAEGATYVSAYLRRRYPTRHPEREWVFCSVEFSPEAVGRPRPVEFFGRRPFRLISVGRFSPEKGHVYLVRALRHLRQLAPSPLQLHLVGDGPDRGALEEESRVLGVADLVHFHGYVPRGPELFALLDGMHLFVLPSLTEGMGRGLIEAMARGLPCVGSAVGGIPEYLPREALCPPGDPQAIAERIAPLLGQPETLARMSARNFEAVRRFWTPGRQEGKTAFWSMVRGLCEQGAAAKQLSVQGTGAGRKARFFC